MTDPIPPQQPNRPEGLREILTQLHESSRYAFNKSPQDNAKAILEAEAAIRTRIERATPELYDHSLDRPAKGQTKQSQHDYNKFVDGRNAAIKEFESNIQRELGI